MANALYDGFVNGQMDTASQIDIHGNANIKATLVNVSGAGTLYTFSAAHDFMTTTNVPSAARIATATLTGVTFASRAMDANDLVFTAVSGDSVEAIIIWHDTTNPATSRMIAYIDTATGLAVTPNGGDITIQWAGSPNFIFRIA